MVDLFKEVIPSILQTKKNTLTDETEKVYNPYVVNRAISFHLDCVMPANQMNMIPNTDRLLQYHYLLNTVRSYKRPFQKWQKREDIDGLEAVKEYYNLSNEKAKDALSLLSKDQLDEIRKRLNKGGLNVRHKRTGRGDAE